MYTRTHIFKFINKVSKDSFRLFCINYTDTLFKDGLNFSLFIKLKLTKLSEEKAITQFDRESEDIKDWVLMEFAKQFDGEKGRMKISQRIDEDITKAVDILDDPFTYREVFLHY